MSRVCHGWKHGFRQPAAMLAPFLLVATTHAQAQSSIGGAQAENVQVVVRGARVQVSYDLVSKDAAATFSARLEISRDGQTYDLRPVSISGDVGAGVKAGPGKRIIWDAARDIEALDLDTFRYRVTLEPESSPRPVSELAAGATGTPPSPGSARSTTATPAMRTKTLLGFGDLPTRLKVGDLVEMTNTGGRRIRGSVLEVLGSSVSVNVPPTSPLAPLPDILAEDSVTEVRVRRSDSVWNGLAIFAGIGAGAGYAIGVASGECHYEYDYYGRYLYCHGYKTAGAFGGAALGAVAGLIVDIRRQRYDVVYQKPDTTRGVNLTVTPRFAGHGWSLDLALGF